MSSLNQEENPPPNSPQNPEQNPVEDPQNPESGTPGANGQRGISRRGEEARGGFVLRAKSEEMPHRRRSLVERTGMKTLVQASISLSCHREKIRST